MRILNLTQKHELLEDELVREGFCNPEGITKTLANMITIKGSFDGVSVIDNEILTVVQHSRFLIGIQKEIALKRNELAEEKEKALAEQDRKTNAGVYTEENKRRLPTDTARQKHVKAKHDELYAEIKKLERDFGAVLDFIGNQLWHLKDYLKVLDEQRKYHVALHLAERGIKT